MKAGRLEEFWKMRPVRKIVMNGVEIFFDCSSKVADFRARTLLSKEPGTIRWLDRLSPDDVLYDVGANVGTYSIYAAKMRGVRCYSIEPDARNFALLCSNVMLNGLSGKVMPYCLGALDRTGPSVLFARNREAGSSGHSVGEALDEALNPVEPDFRQGIYAIRLEDFAASDTVETPTVIKIDVDGLEHLVLSGLGRVLDDTRLRGINIELADDIDEHRKLRLSLQEAGFREDDELGFVHRNGVNRNIFFSR
ncbi:MAG: FkbM family methyltransferase [Nisaea sp.]|uniref:FkbM family methyltransferase n=1 Tax=Nisaea sp. TaxID=2024842 RepID=UPI001B046174|nr:FkbM family methyltransferase [Nisaea sp.]MBO6559388.1 FkbM family methyltransferase [Nisaea sp.]